MNFAAIALGAMLAVAEPGVSEGSRVELLGAPTASTLELAGLPAEPPGFRWSRASWSDWTRRETEQEALGRWGTIALAIRRVAADPPPTWRWTGREGRLQLVRALVTIARHESAFWRSVHDGRLRGPAGEACLVQIHPELGGRWGIDLEQLVGTDLAATERCFRVGAMLLGRARAWVEHESERCAGDWFIPTVATYGSGLDCVPRGDWIDGVAARFVTYNKTGARKPLPFRGLLALEN